MTYKEWSEEYRISAEQLKEKIQNLKDEVNTAPISTISSIDARIKILYQMYLNCRETAEILAARMGEV